MLALLLSGCVGIKPGTYKLSQPAGTGAVNLRFSVCTLVVGPPPPGSELPTIVCGPAPGPSEGQMLVTLIVPAGSTTPESFSAVPGPGAIATTLTRSPELTAQMKSTELTPGGTVGPPPGFEVVGYTSGPVAETTGQERTWTMEAGIGLPPGVGGGSYGGPFKATAIVGWRTVGGGFPISRPIKCKGEEPAETFCGFASPNGEATLGVSDLKVSAPPPIAVVPGAKVKPSFVLDFASSAAELPKFTLTATSTLPDAEIGLSNSTFTRAPTEPGTNRAPATTRKAIVQVPTSAPLGSYELALTATAAQGGAAGATTTLVVKPKGRAKVTVPKLVKAKLAFSRGIPVRLTAPIAGTRFLTRLKGPGPSGRGRVQLLRKIRISRELGTTLLRLRIARAKAEAFLAAGATLRVEATINQPGAKKPIRMARAVKLR